MFPQHSVLALLRRVVSGHSDGTSAWSATVSRTLRPSARFAARSFAAREADGAAVMPECCTPIAPLTDVSVAEQVVSLRDMAPDVLTGELQALSEELHGAEGGRAVLSPWQPAARQPRQWLASMADASLDAWSAMEPRWRAATPSFDQEVRRVGTAAVRGCMGTLLNSLHPSISFAEGVLAFAFPYDRYETLGERRLVLMPMLGEHDPLVASFDRQDVCYVGYPIRPPNRSMQPEANEALALILGPVRAAALRALDRPLTVGELAAAVQCAPTTATYHLQQLDQAGLISRQRDGMSVWASRTPRGDGLIDLLSD